MYQIGRKYAFKYNSPKDPDISVAAAIFDLEECTFKIVIRNADIKSQGDTVDFRIKFGDFDETVRLQLREEKENWFIYP